MRLYLLFARWKVFLVDNTRSELCEVVETKVIVHSSHTMWNRGFISWSESESEHPNTYLRTWHHVAGMDVLFFVDWRFDALLYFDLFIFGIVAEGNCNFWQPK